MSKFTDNNYKPGQIYSTKDYEQFKVVVGNRPINIEHVNKLIASIAQENLLKNFPGFISSDGYLIDGQHRLIAAKSNKLAFFFTVSEKVIEKHLIADRAVSFYPGFNTGTQDTWFTNR